MQILHLQLDERDGMFVTRGEVMYGASCRGIRVVGFEVEVERMRILIEAGMAVA